VLLSVRFGLPAAGYQRRVLFNPALTDALFPTADAHSGKLAVSNPLSKLLKKFMSQKLRRSRR
jgi:hypothetical protein